MWLPGAAGLLFMLIVASVSGIADAGQAVPQEFAAASDGRSWPPKGDAGVVTSAGMSPPITRPKQHTRRRTETNARHLLGTDPGQPDPVHAV